MAQDPAFLFYTSDFLTGTTLFTNEQIGKYIRLLCLQHQHGHLHEQDMMLICVSYDARIFSKFVRDDDGLYYNERLDIEHFKRKKYCESRGENRKRGIEAPNSYEPHMENENYNPLVPLVIVVDEKFEKFKAWINENAPNVGKMKEPFTHAQFLKLKEDFNNGQISELLERMHNYKNLTKNVSANLTFRNWAKKNFPAETQEPYSLVGKLAI